MAFKRWRLFLAALKSGGAARMSTQHDLSRRHESGTAKTDTFLLATAPQMAHFGAKWLPRRRRPSWTQTLLVTTLMPLGEHRVNSTRRILSLFSKPTFNTPTDFSVFCARLFHRPIHVFVVFTQSGKLRWKTRRRLANYCAIWERRCAAVPLLRTVCTRRRKRFQLSQLSLASLENVSTCCTTSYKERKKERALTRLSANESTTFTLV